MQDPLLPNVCVGSAIKKLIDQKIASMAEHGGSTNKGGDPVRAFEKPQHNPRAAAPRRRHAPARLDEAGQARP
jgi:hypothetical protein